MFAYNINLSMTRCIVLYDIHLNVRTSVHITPGFSSLLDLMGRWCMRSDWPRLSLKVELTGMLTECLHLIQCHTITCS